MSKNLVYDVLVLNTRNDLDRPAALTAGMISDKPQPLFTTAIGRAFTEPPKFHGPTYC